MKKLILCLLLILCGCTSQTDLKETNEILLFYSTTCGSCQDLKEHLVGKLEDNGFKVVLYDMDEFASITEYEAIVDQLVSPDANLKINNPTPMLVYKPYFAAVGYDTNLDDFFINLFTQCRDGNTSVIDEVGSGIWRFK